MKDRPDRRERWRWGVLGVGVLLVLALRPGRTLAAGTSPAALLAAGMSASVPLATPVERAKVKIPARPELRSPCQPPVWVPGPPPWAGGPTWVPGPPPWTKPAPGLAALKPVAAGATK